MDAPWLRQISFSLCRKTPAAHLTVGIPTLPGKTKGKGQTPVADARLPNLTETRDPLVKGALEEERASKPIKRGAAAAEFSPEGPRLPLIFWLRSNFYQELITKCPL